jgi:hypothetical protein
MFFASSATSPRAVRDALLADVARARMALQLRADRLRYVLNGGADRAALSQIEAYEDAAAELAELLSRYDHGGDGATGF